MKDIDLQSDYGNFKLRVSVVLIKDNFVLLEKAKKYNGYVLPGGHVELGETTIDALKRETTEELKCKVLKYKLICVLENIYKFEDKTAQEINYFYEISTNLEKTETEFKLEEIDKGQKKIHNYVWCDISEINKVSLYPKVLKKLIKNKKYDNIIFCDNR